MDTLRRQYSKYEGRVAIETKKFYSNEKNKKFIAYECDKLKEFLKSNIQVLEMV